MLEDITVLGCFVSVTDLQDLTNSEIGLDQDVGEGV